MSRELFAVVAGGGTAGHLEPALAIAEALVVRGHGRDTIAFLGSRRGQDAAALAGRGFPSVLLPGRGLARSTRPADLVRNLGAAAGLLVGTGQALGMLARSRPSVVVSVGGYASVPAALSAVVLRIPLVLVNVDAVPGAANRLLGRFARASAVGWPGTPLPRAEVTGTPVRPGIVAVARTPEAQGAARAELGLPSDRVTVAAFGGSLGARSVNRAVAQLAERWADREDRSVYHVVGRRDWDDAEEAARPAPAGGLHYRRVPYESNMEAVYTAADVVICRAGAMTVAELATTGTPAVLVPLPGAPGDHQTANALVLERAGAAVLVPDNELGPERLDGVLQRLLHEGRLAEMGAAAAGLARPDAADAGAALVERSASSRHRSADDQRGGAR